MEDQERSVERRLGAIGIVICVIAAYWPALHAGFIWDDDSYVTENVALRSLNGLRRLWFERGTVPQYYPLTHTTFWIEYHLWGLAPAGYHAVNVLLHAANALLHQKQTGGSSSGMGYLDTSFLERAGLLGCPPEWEALSEQVLGELAGHRL